MLTCSPPPTSEHELNKEFLQRSDSEISPRITSEKYHFYLK